MNISEVLPLHGLWLQGDPSGARADLSGADLSRADLSGADLSDADLSGAVLSDAVLSGADLSRADLSGADLSDADLSGADLSDAVLSRADLSGADLSDAVLRGAVLSGADLSDAVLRGADLSDAVLSRADLSELFKVERLHTRMLEAIEAGGGLDMDDWHRCETTHCRAGWAIHLAGPTGKLAEALLGPAAAGALITMASCPYLDRVPDFYCDNEDALADIRRCAAIEKEALVTLSSPEAAASGGGE